MLRNSRDTGATPERSGGLEYAPLCQLLDLLCHKRHALTRQLHGRVQKAIERESGKLAVGGRHRSRIEAYRGIVDSCRARAPQGAEFDTSE